MLQDKTVPGGAGTWHGVEPTAARDRIIALEHEVAQLREALNQRQLYGVVTGLLAARFGLTPERTWPLLVRLSQSSNLKMRVVARLVHDLYCDQLSAEDEPLAALLDAQLRGQFRAAGSEAAEPEPAKVAH